MNEKTPEAAHIDLKPFLSTIPDRFGDWLRVDVEEISHTIQWHQHYTNPTINDPEGAQETAALLGIQYAKLAVATDFILTHSPQAVGTSDTLNNVKSLKSAITRTINPQLPFQSFPDVINQYIPPIDGRYLDIKAYFVTAAVDTYEDFFVNLWMDHFKEKGDQTTGQDELLHAALEELHDPESLLNKKTTSSAVIHLMYEYPSAHSPLFPQALEKIFEVKYFSLSNIYLQNNAALFTAGYLTGLSYGNNQLMEEFGILLFALYGENPNPADFFINGHRTLPKSWQKIAGITDREMEELSRTANDIDSFTEHIRMCAFEEWKKGFLDTQKKENPKEYQKNGPNDQELDQLFIDYVERRGEIIQLEERNDLIACLAKQKSGNPSFPGYKIADYALKKIAGEISDYLNHIITRHIKNLCSDDETLLLDQFIACLILMNSDGNKPIDNNFITTSGKLLSEVASFEPFNAVENTFAITFSRCTPNIPKKCAAIVSHIQAIRLALEIDLA